MNRLAALLAACALISRAAPAAGATPLAAAPFPVVEEARTPEPSHTAAYSCMVAGAALVAFSFRLSQRADHYYDEYLLAIEEARIEHLYDRTLRYDRWSRASLLGGEALLATGLYLRFVRRPSPPRAQLELAPDRCAVSVRF
jgi:hypothetical protein